MPFPFPCSPVIRECSWKKNPDGKKMFFSSIKKMNRLINKGMSNNYYWEKLTLSKLVGEENFPERKFEDMH